ncbi:MAG TPA: metallophosphatase [Bacteroidales bacterium]|nr:metallophosphatase [Bacteroidales bacterium]HOH22056.1 metallophosphatase [Bacteroidales bacterium]HPZ03339.1 metallophosphatase [Bacteroidales bacterium]HQB75082.1 metallophosphatase [Bacteroidales bacterium]
MHTNDTHSQIDPVETQTYGNVGGVLRRFQLIQETRQKEPHMLLLDAGDFFQGSPFYNFFEGAVEIELMNMMGYDVVTLGNHEFDNGSAELAKQLKKASFKVVCANYKFKNRKLRKIVKPYTVIRVNNVKIGIFGLTASLSGLVSPSILKEVTFLDPITSGKKMVELLKKKEKCDLIICLSHLGYTPVGDNLISDPMLAETVDGIDLIIGGHTHTYLEEPEVINGTRIYQTGSKGIHIGKINIVINK